MESIVRRAPRIVKQTGAGWSGRSAPSLVRFGPVADGSGMTRALPHPGSARQREGSPGARRFTHATDLGIRAFVDRRDRSVRARLGANPEPVPVSAVSKDDRIAGEERRGESRPGSGTFHTRSPEDGCLAPGVGTPERLDEVAQSQLQADRRLGHVHEEDRVRRPGTSGKPQQGVFELREGRLRRQVEDLSRADHLLGRPRLSVRQRHAADLHLHPGSDRTASVPWKKAPCRSCST